MAIDLERIEEAPHILDILLQTEDILDSLDIYCYKNWIDGEVIDGPNVRRHWISISLLYPHNKMPDPRAALRLLKHDVIVEFSKVQRSAVDSPLPPATADAVPLAPAPATAPASADPAAPALQPSGPALMSPAPAPPAAAGADVNGTQDAAPQRCWMVKIAFPRRLLTQMGADLSFYDDEVDVEDVEAAKDSGLDDESGYDAEQQAPTQAVEPGGGDPGANDPNAPPPPGAAPPSF